ncbi:MAG TPA: flagellar hook capping FlgD N-terminal domain-containing protein [Spirochaetia bacterium]|nr:flagellar hook capping FlgD N-terminal domain-containing protein [Spirochaetia bacterium]
MNISNGIDLKMNGQDEAKVKMQVDALNSTLNNGRKVKQSLDKNDFLKLLTTQLTHQDPMQPMQDTAFIAQMAQFSTLEQITNMAQGFSNVANLMKSSDALGLLGKTVSISADGKTVSGVVNQVSGGQFPQVLVDGNYYDYSQVVDVRK